jgi:hypothetical protein
MQIIARSKCAKEFGLKWRTLLAAVLSLMLFGDAEALVIEAKTEAQKLRADIGKQLTGLAGCFSKAWQKCEKGTDPLTTSCSIETGETDLDASYPGDLSGKFADDIAKCVSKVDFLKKAKDLNATTGYEAVGCPGDSDSVVAGDQRFSDMDAYEAGAIASLRVTVDQFGLLAAVSGCDTDPKVEKCVSTLIKSLDLYTKGIGLCQWKCENDYKGKKGGGGPNDEDNCHVPDYTSNAPTPDPAMIACSDKALSKLTKKYPAGLPPLFDSLVMPLVVDDINSGNDAFYNVSGGNCSS